MKITKDWLKDHLETTLTENQIIEKLTDEDWKLKA
jgi:hypothetical protein